MTEFNISVPVRGTEVYSVEADSFDEAVEKILEHPYKYLEDSTAEFDGDFYDMGGL